MKAFADNSQVVSQKYKDNPSKTGYTSFTQTLRGQGSRLPP